jgi:hypothetical protein
VHAQALDEGKIERRVRALTERRPQLGEKRRHVLTPCAQWRQSQAHAVEARQQVRTKPSLAHRIEQRFLPGHDDTHVDGDGPRLPERLHFALLEHA